MALKLVRLKPACSATKKTFNIELFNKATLATMLTRKQLQITKALIRLRGCASWSPPLFPYATKVNFSQDVAHMIDYYKILSM